MIIPDDTKINFEIREIGKARIEIDLWCDKKDYDFRMDMTRELLFNTLYKVVKDFFKTEGWTE